MIKNKKLLIDANCPLCRLYGNGFEKFHFIDGETVTYYQTSAIDYCWKVNLERAKSEIALIDGTTGETKYGIDALLEIIGTKFPRLGSVLNYQPLYFILSKFYRLVSFNRKVIAMRSSDVKGLSCTPPVHKVYRWTYILLASIFTGFVLTKFANLLNNALGFKSIPYLEYAICFGQIVWQGAVVRYSFPKKTLDYLGNMSTVSFLGGILLIPVLLIQHVFGLGEIYLLISFCLVLLIMVQNHISRCKNLDIPIWITFTWLGYRTLILFGILYLNFN